MEREKEIAKLVNVLRRIARAATYATANRVEPDAAGFCAGQYNRVLARLRELEPSIAQLFTPLPDGASPSVIRIAARELAAYFEDEVGTHSHHDSWHVRFAWSPIKGCYW